MTKPKAPQPPRPPRPAAEQHARAHPRTKIELSAEIDTFKDRFTAATRDLSLGGAGLDLDRPLKEGAAVAVALFLVVDEVEDEQTKPLNVPAKVAWCAEADEEHRWAAGVRFENLSPQQTDWLGQFLQSIKHE